jgi:arylsulfatase A-like enzyme
MKPEIKNAIVLMFDTLQFNYVGAYGNSWIQTPWMDRLAKEGTLFENFYVEGLPTIPCRRAMHTGRYTLPVSGWVPLNMEDTTIADLCWGRPIDTVLIFDCPQYRLPKFGYTRSFDQVMFTHGHEADDAYFENDDLNLYHWEDYVEEHTLDAYCEKYGTKVMENAVRDEINNYLRQRQYYGDEESRYVFKTISNAIDYLEKADRGKQFFIWIDSFDPHEPWDPPSVWDPKTPCMYDPDYKGKHMFLPCAELVDGLYTEPELHHIRMLYAEMVTVCDRQLGRLMKAIHKLGYDENTMLWMVSDHGQPLGNGEHGHGLMRKCRPWPYEELAHAPSIIRVPGAKSGQRISSFIQSVDVAPTVCAWLGIGIHPDMQGKNLLPLIFGEVDKVRDFAIAGYYDYSWSIITEDWSYIHWLQPDEDGKIMRLKFYRGNIDGSHLEATGGKGKMMAHLQDALEEATGINLAEERHKKKATTDGAAQWTCTPAATSEVPTKDELYNRKTDPFQLHNIADENPKIALELLQKLKGFMAELRAC